MVYPSELWGGIVQSEPSLQQSVDWLFWIQGLANLISFGVLAKQSVQPHSQSGRISSIKRKELRNRFLQAIVFGSQFGVRSYPEQDGQTFQHSVERTCGS